MNQAFFVTGTDTEIGKTTIAAGLLHAARMAGLSTAAAKPVASGCELTEAGLCKGDALALLGECSLPLRYEQVNPLAFAPAIAPHLAAREVGVDEVCVCVAGDKRRVGEYIEEKIAIGANADDHQLAQRAAHAPDRFVAIAAGGDELGQHRVVVHRHHTAGLYTRVDANPVAGRRANAVADRERA